MRQINKDSHMATKPKFHPVDPAKEPAKEPAKVPPAKTPKKPGK